MKVAIVAIFVIYASSISALSIRPPWLGYWNKNEIPAVAPLLTPQCCSCAGGGLRSAHVLPVVQPWLEQSNKNSASGNTNTELAIHQAENEGNYEFLNNAVRANPNLIQFVQHPEYLQDSTYQKVNQKNKESSVNYKHNNQYDYSNEDQLRSGSSAIPYIHYYK